MSDRLSLFQAIGLSEQKAKETIKNEVLSAKLETVVKQVRILTIRFQPWNPDFSLTYITFFYLIDSKMKHIDVVLVSYKALVYICLTNSPLNLT